MRRCKKQKRIAEDTGRSLQLVGEEIRRGMRGRREYRAAGAPIRADRTAGAKQGNRGVIGYGRFRKLVNVTEILNETKKKQSRKGQRGDEEDPNFKSGF